MANELVLVGVLFGDKSGEKVSAIAFGTAKIMDNVVVVFILEVDLKGYRMMGYT